MSDEHPFKVRFLVLVLYLPHRDLVGPVSLICLKWWVQSPHAVPKRIGEDDERFHF